MSHPVTLSELLRSFTVSEWWALAGAFVALVVGSVSLGGWVQSVRDDSKLREKDTVISNLNRRISAIEKERDEARRNFDEATRTLQQVAGKAVFLDRWLSYKNVPGDISRKLFVDHLCDLWKRSREYSIRVTSGPIDITPDQIRGGLSPELRQLLVDNGVPGIFSANAGYCIPWSDSDNSEACAIRVSSQNSSILRRNGL